MGCDQSNVRKPPATEAEKTSMTEPWAVDKCPKQYVFCDIGSSWRWGKNTTTVHVVFPRTSPSVMAHIREPSSLPWSLRQERRITTFANAEEVPTYPIAMEPIKSWISETMIYPNLNQHQTNPNLFALNLQKWRVIYIGFYLCIWFGIIN